MVPKQLCTMSLKSMQISLPNVGTKKYRSKKCCTLNRDWWWWYHLLLPKPTRPWILNLFSTNSRRHYNKSYQKRSAQSFINWYIYILSLTNISFALQSFLGLIFIEVVWFSIISMFQRWLGLNVLVCMSVLKDWILY